MAEIYKFAPITSPGAVASVSLTTFQLASRAESLFLGKGGLEATARKLEQLVKKRKRVKARIRQLQAESGKRAWEHRRMEQLGLDFPRGHSMADPNLEIIRVAGKYGLTQFVPQSVYAKAAMVRRALMILREIIPHGRDAAIFLQNFDNLKPSCVYEETFALAREVAKTGDVTDQFLPLEKGNYGKIYLFTTDDGTTYVYKIVEKGYFRDKLKREAEVLAHLNHLDRISHIYGLTLNGIIMRRSREGSLAQALERDQFNDPVSFKELFRRIVQALIRIHREGVVHRDVKSQNIFLDRYTDNGAGGSSSPVIGDFGLSAHLEEDGRIRGRVGTPLFMAPEVLWRERYDGRADVWSLGVMIYSMASGGQPPFGRVVYPSRSVPYSILDGLDENKWWQDYSALVMGNHQQGPPFIEKEIQKGLLRDLLYRMLTKDVNERLTMEEVLKHPYFTQSEQLF